jgi:hypothetical protein
MLTIKADKPNLSANVLHLLQDIKLFKNFWELLKSLKTYRVPDLGLDLFLFVTIFATFLARDPL